MVFKKNFIAVVKCDGRILREREDSTVYLPFGKEYELVLKNQESKKVEVKITIDGQDVLNGHSLVLDPNSESRLEGFLGTDGNVSHRFKFIQKTEQIIEHRGDKLGDGMIRIEFQYERDKPEIHTTIHHHETYQPFIPYIPPPSIPWRDDTIFCDTGLNEPMIINYCQSGVSQGIQSSMFASTRSKGLSAPVPASFSSPVIPNPDEGITVKGSHSNQKMQRAWIGALEENSHVIVINLKGTNDNETPVQRPLTVTTKLVCPTCGTANKSKYKFCTNCGTALN